MRAKRRIMPREIDNLMIGTQTLPQISEGGMRRSDNHDVAALQGIVEVADQQARKMRQMLHGEAAVAPDEAGELQIAIVDGDLEAFAEEALRQLDQGALAQIVGIGLEGQPQHRHPPLSVARDQADGPVDLLLIGGEGGVEHMKLGTSLILA